MGMLLFGFASAVISQELFPGSLKSFSSSRELGGNPFQAGVLWGYFMLPVLAQGRPGVSSGC